MSNVSMKARSWSFSSESDVGKTNIDPFSAVYAVQKQIREGWILSYLPVSTCSLWQPIQGFTCVFFKGVFFVLSVGNHVLGGKACSVLVKVANSEVMRFVTSSDVIAYLEATKITNPTEMHPFPLTKVKRCPVEANSAVNNFGPFSFLSLNIYSPGLKACPDITFLNFKVPGPKLETNLQAYTFAGSKKVTLKFVYEKATGKHVLSKCQGDQLQKRFVLGAPVIIEDEAVTCLRSSSRWPVVGVVGLDEDLKVCPYFVSANMFADSSSGESCEGSSRSSGVAHAPSGAQECYELGLKSARQAGDRATERKAILKLGNVYSSSGEHRQAIQCYTKSLDISKEAGDLAGIKLAQECLLKSYLDLGDTQLFCGNHRQAIKFYTNSFDIAKETGDQAGVKLSQERLRKSYLDLGDNHLLCGDHQQAIKFYTNSFDIAKETGDQAGVKLFQERLRKSYLDLGDNHLLCSRSDHQQAIEFYKKSLDMEAGDLVEVKLAQERLQKSYLDLGDTHLFCSRGVHREAIKFYTKSIDIAKEAGDLVGVKLAQERLRKSYLDFGDTHLFWSVRFQCWDHMRYVSTGRASWFDAVTLFMSERGLDQMTESLCSSRGDHQQAIEFYTQSIDIAKEADDLVGVKLAQERLRKSYLDLGDTHLLCSHGDHQQAIEFYTKSLNIAKEASDLAGVTIAKERLQKCLAIPKQGERLAPGNESNATAADENFPSNHEKGQSCYKHTQAMLL